ncbi:FKBP-type peptidyl-prolyl cis-trans isomerase [Pedobacter sp. SYSU D00535]|uniref:FKBP-type peptidyl-prolyl cis-trans isomerase n=1 Tax=Pedobacter sp. SYSU D00535 TaxID=2810308 RepID=UPI001A966310|nr:FKBP-type peptidyl-prolyl cis-trans isomerase [Pedobacter sp. SYSU D00535]
MRKLVLLLIAAISLAGCKKNDPYNAQKQLEADEQLIKAFIAEKNITNAQRHASGMYYVITSPGAGNFQYTQSSGVQVKYKLRLLNGTEIEQPTDPVCLTLGRVIPGWQYGIPLIQKGGKIRLLIPSVYAYGPNPAGAIPANSVLDFDIEVLDVSTQPCTN